MLHTLHSQFAIQYLAQSHFNIQTAGDRTTDLLISGGLIGVALYVLVLVTEPHKR